MQRLGYVLNHDRLSFALMTAETGTMVQDLMPSAPTAAALVAFVLASSAAQCLGNTANSSLLAQAVRDLQRKLKQSSSKPFGNVLRPRQL